MAGSIPKEVYLPFLDRTIDIHWDYHALLMVTIWFVLVPVGIVATRFFKPGPTLYGIEKGTGRLDSRLLWWTLHFGCLYSAIGLSLAGALVAIVVSGGFSGSVHALFGMATIAFGCLQIVSAWFRGSHGGKHGAQSDPDDPDTWRGDHFDMTPQRRWFEAWHKTAGYFSVLLALVAVVTGLMQFWMPAIAFGLVAIFLCGLVLFVVLEGKGFRHDTYRSVYGNHPDNPYNKTRKDL